MKSNNSIPADHPKLRLGFHRYRLVAADFSRYTTSMEAIAESNV